MKVVQITNQIHLKFALSCLNKKKIFIYTRMRQKGNVRERSMETEREKEVWRQRERKKESKSEKAREKEGKQE